MPPVERDRGITVAIEGFFAMAWFGLTSRATGRPRLMTDRAARRRYGIIVGLIIGPGAGLCLLIFGVATAIAGLREAPEAGG